MPILTFRHIILSILVLLGATLGISIGGNYFLKESIIEPDQDSLDFHLNQRPITKISRKLTEADSINIAEAIRDTLNKIDLVTQKQIEADSPSLSLPSSAEILKISSLNMQDTIYPDTNNVNDTIHEIEVNEWEQIVEKDQLLKTVIYTLSDSSKVSKVDSISSSLADIRISNSQKYYIQFWKTPLNSIGYKYANYKVLLYGIEPDTNLILEKKSESLILHANGEVWLLSPSYEFTSMVKYDTNAAN